MNNETLQIFEKPESNNFPFLPDVNNVFIEAGHTGQFGAFDEVGINQAKFGAEIAVKLAQIIEEGVSLYF